MDTLKKLDLEYQGMRNTILSYTSDGNIVGFLNGLELQLKNKDIEAVRYYLQQICDWYSQNIQEIQINEFVVDQDAHNRNRALLETILQDLAQYDYQEDYNSQTVSNKYTKIFLSHSSVDKKYGDALQKLLTNIGIKNLDLIYTSHALHKIPEGDKIYDYLKINFNKNLFVIFLWSNDYLKSAACLNEMGAAWVSENDFVNIYTPDFNFDNPQYHNCAVDTRQMGIVLKNDELCKAGMTEFKDRIIKAFNLPESEQQWIYHLDLFMKDIC